VECGINLLKHPRAVTPLYDELAVRYQATLHVATINIRLPALARAPPKTDFSTRSSRPLPCCDGERARL
jgi:hypothetical protein